MSCESSNSSSSTHPNFSVAVGNHSRKHMMLLLAHGRICQPACPLPLRRWKCNKLDCLLCKEASEYLLRWKKNKLWKLESCKSFWKASAMLTIKRRISENEKKKKTSEQRLSNFFATASSAISTFFKAKERTFDHKSRYHSPCSRKFTDWLHHHST